MSFTFPGDGQQSDSYHCSVQEGVNVEHGLQLQSVIQTVVLIALPVKQTVMTRHTVSVHVLRLRGGNYFLTKEEN